MYDNLTFLNRKGVFVWDVQGEALVGAAADAAEDFPAVGAAAVFPAADAVGAAAPHGKQDHLAAISAIHPAISLDTAGIAAAAAMAMSLPAPFLRQLLSF